MIALTPAAACRNNRDIDYAKRLTGCVASLLDTHARQPFFGMAPLGVTVRDPNKRRRSAKDLSKNTVAGDGCGCLKFGSDFIKL